MTGWEFLFVAIVVAIVGLGCFCWGWAMGIDDERRAQDADDAETAKEPLGWLPLHTTPPGDKRLAAMRQHPAGGRR